MESAPSGPRLSRLALASLILGILGVTCLSVLAGIPAIICGHLARRRILAASDNVLRGSTQALVGLVLGYLSVAITLVLLPLLFFLATPAMEVIEKEDRSQRLILNARQLHQAVQAAALDAFSANRPGLGWPLDAGISTRQQLRAVLVAGDYLSEEDADEIGFDSFLIGNVAQIDGADTIFLISRPQAAGESVVLILKSGESRLFDSVEEAREAGALPPRQPEFLD